MYKKSIGQACIFILFFGFMGYCFFWGGYLRYNDIKNEEREYTGGAIVAIMFSVIFGAMGLGSVGPHIAAISEGKVAGKLAFSNIDHKTEI